MFSTVKKPAKPQIMDLIERNDIIEVMRVLEGEEKQYDTNVQTENGTMPVLNAAIQAGKAKLVEQLVEKGADYLQLNNRHRDERALRVAISSKHKAIFDLLLTLHERVEPTALENEGYIEAAFQVDDGYFARKMTHAGARCSVTDMNMDMLVTDFTGEEAAKLVNRCVGVRNKKDIVGRVIKQALKNDETAFIPDFVKACTFSKSYMTELLRDTPVDEDMLQEVVSALLPAAERNGNLYEDALIICLDNKESRYDVVAAMEHIDDERLINMTVKGLPAIIYAVQRGSEYFINKIKEKSLDLNVQDKDGKTPLMHAVITCNQPLMRTFADDGRVSDAELKVKDNDGLTAADHAQRSNNHSVSHFFTERYGATDLWVISDDCEIAHIKKKDALNIEMTEIFNFSALERTTLIKSKGGNAVESMHRDAFDDIPSKKHLSVAFNRYQLIKQDAPEDVVEAMKKYDVDTQKKAERLSLPKR